MGVRVSGPLCRDPHVLLVADAELDLDLAIMLLKDRYRLLLQNPQDKKDRFGNRWQKNR